MTAAIALPRLHGLALDAVVTEPANTATMEMILDELKGKLGLVVLSAWGPSEAQPWPPSSAPA